MSAELMQLLMGYRATQAIHVAAVLGIPDLLAAGATAERRARARRQAPTPTRSTGSCARWRRSASSRRTASARFALTPLGEPLRSDVPGSLHGWALLVGRADALALLGQPRAQHPHGRELVPRAPRHGHLGMAGRPAGGERDLRRRDEIADRALEPTQSSTAYDFGRFDTIVDVGGGNGALLAAILGAHSNARGVLFDQPHVVAGAASVLEAVADRIDIVAGSFFDVGPGGRGRLHPEDRSSTTGRTKRRSQILRVCRAAMSPEARLLVIERILAPPNEGADGKFSDLNMLVMPGGRERTEGEFATLFERAGLRLAQTVPTAAGIAVIEAVGSKP